jgi:NADH-quinone oxidoreductase subunit N
LQWTDLIALLPLLILTATSVVVMMAIAIHRSHRLTALLTMIGLICAFASLWVAGTLIPTDASPLLVVDGYALFYLGLIIAATFAVVLFSFDYLEKQSRDREEYYILLLVATLGSGVLIESAHFVSFLLGLELLSVSLYALCAYVYSRNAPIEAGIKYLVLAAGSASFLLFGMALVYARLGTMEFEQIGQLMASGTLFKDPLILGGLALIITGFGFKLALVPFHLWTPDVYEGAPAPVTAYVATVSKGAVFALLLRFFYSTGVKNLGPIFLVFSIIAIASMIVGNLLALLQTNVKRILAYSSIAHLGYILVAFLAGGAWAAEAVTFYLVAYFITTLGAFGVITVLSSETRDADRIEDYRGLFWRRPILAGIFTLMLLSLAGIPLTVGFVGKFFLVTAGASGALWNLVLILVLSSVIGLFYYLRVLVALYATTDHGKPVEAAALPAPSALGSSALVVLSALLVWLGVYPTYILDVIQRAVASLKLL